MSRHGTRRSVQSIVTSSSPPNYNLSKKCAAALVLFIAAAMLPASANTDAPYEELFYDYEVAGYCGLVDKSVYTAFGYKRAALEVDSGQTVEQRTEAPIRAMATADQEYMNKGLGGFNSWCQNEGKDGAWRIVAD